VMAVTYSRANCTTTRPSCHNDLCRSPNLDSTPAFSRA
jgi:hypothetical protein